MSVKGVYEHVFLRVAVGKTDKPRGGPSSAPSSEQALGKWWPLCSLFAGHSYELKAVGGVQSGTFSGAKTGNLRLHFWLAE